MPPDRIQWLEDRIKQLEQAGDLPHKDNSPSANLSREVVFNTGRSDLPGGERAARSYSRDIDHLHPPAMLQDDHGRSEMPIISSDALLAETAPPSTSKPSTLRQDVSTTLDEVSPSDTRSVAIIGATTTEDQREGFFGSASAGTFVSPALIPHKSS